MGGDAPVHTVADLPDGGGREIMTDGEIGRIGAMGKLNENFPVTNGEGRLVEDMAQRRLITGFLPLALQAITDVGGGIGDAIGFVLLKIARDNSQLRPAAETIDEDMVDDDGKVGMETALRAVVTTVAEDVDQTDEHVLGRVIHIFLAAEAALADEELDDGTIEIVEAGPVGVILGGDAGESVEKRMGRDGNHG